MSALRPDAPAVPEILDRFRDGSRVSPFDIRSDSRPHQRGFVSP